MSIAVMGSGAFGTALAVSIAAQSDVTLWARDPDHAHAMQSGRENTARLPGVTLPDRLTASHEITDMDGADMVLLAVPMQQLRQVVQTYHDALRERVLIACCKGIELTSGRGPISILTEELPSARPSLLTGPSFAADIARGLPTALTLACADGDLGRVVQHALTTANLRLYRTTDVIGAELGGALKNVIAIACGAVIGAGLGDSARAALMTRGYAEMQRMALALSAQPETLAGLSGFGDLSLTCTSELSRNYQLGLSIGRGTGFDPSVTVEGAATARAVATRIDRMGLDMPITRGVVALLDQTHTVQELMAALLARPLKEE